MPFHDLNQLEAKGCGRPLQDIVDNQLDIRVDSISKVLGTDVIDLIEVSHEAQSHPKDCESR